ncbi:unnamed protein product [Urochloa decumbens]|uniref:Uncharacterized protein n=1 Tax=Urochloa decumbens TaxID=240449 RepID=A0ABC8WX69_9POAL
MNAIDDMAALVIVPSVSRMGDAIPGIQEDGLRYMAFDEAVVRQLNSVPVLNEPVLIGPAHATENNPRPSLAAVPTVPHIPLDEPVLSTLEFSPAIQNVQLHQVVLQTDSVARPSSTKMNSRHGMCPLSTCGVEAIGAPPPDLGPACVEVASTPPPVAPLSAADATFDPTGVVEDVLAPLPASPPRPTRVDASNVPPPVAILEDQTDGEGSPAAALQTEKHPWMLAETQSRLPVDSPELLLQPLRSDGEEVAWRTAEEALSTDFSTEPMMEIASREVNIVYCRRPRASVQQTLQPPDSPPKTPSHAAATSTFIKDVTKPLDIALPLPSVKQQRRHNYVNTEPPRRSRRIANLPPEIQNPSAKAVCRQLGFTDENSEVSVAMIDKYQVFFNSPLKRNDVKVMAAMLRKELPEEFQVQSPEVLVVA